MRELQKLNLRLREEYSKLLYSKFLLDVERLIFEFL